MSQTVTSSKWDREVRASSEACSCDALRDVASLRDADTSLREALCLPCRANPR